jgi:hypothetical protein
MWQRQDLEATGTAVSWAGLDPPPVWLDAARELTEYRTHQQQVRDATADRSAGADQSCVPGAGAGDVPARAALHAARLRRGRGAQVQVRITGEAAMVWGVTREGSGWRLDRGAAARPVALVEADGDPMAAVHPGHHAAGCAHGCGSRVISASPNRSWRSSPSFW